MCHVPNHNLRVYPKAVQDKAIQEFRACLITEKKRYQGNSLTGEEALELLKRLADGKGIQVSSMIPVEMMKIDSLTGAVMNESATLKTNRIVAYYKDSGSIWRPSVGGKRIMRQYDEDPETVVFVDSPEDMKAHLTEAHPKHKCLAWFREQRHSDNSVNFVEYSDPIIQISIENAVELLEVQGIMKKECKEFTGINENSLTNKFLSRLGYRKYTPFGDLVVERHCPDKYRREYTCKHDPKLAETARKRMEAASKAKRKKKEKVEDPRKLERPPRFYDMQTLVYGLTRSLLRKCNIERFVTFNMHYLKAGNFVQCKRSILTLIAAWRSNSPAGGHTYRNLECFREFMKKNRQFLGKYPGDTGVIVDLFFKWFTQEKSCWERKGWKTISYSEFDPCILFKR